jgi:hypothetical protein
MTERLNLKAGNWFQVMGKQVASISSDQLPPGPPDGSDLVGEVVTIDDKPFRVVAVESCRVNHTDQTQRCPQGYGLMVVTHTRYTDTTPEDIAEIDKKYGKTIEELAAEAERGYDVG